MHSLYHYAIINTGTDIKNNLFHRLWFNCASQPKIRHTGDCFISRTFTGSSVKVSIFDTVKPVYNDLTPSAKFCGLLLCTITVVQNMNITWEIPSSATVDWQCSMSNNYCGQRQRQYSIQTGRFNMNHTLSTQGHRSFPLKCIVKDKTTVTFC